ncbi:hypothetical protein QR680_004100 [Steinernema hermaphroditum]|uniref:histone acetyltransferase n=1 Tax=Steinernema hermaphroditum TaxID=289476 RepID=A0AA39HPV1_9BILA|nr:hypothetical protein QR680_004100 [Steinernema hermaphroditum]
MNPPNITNPPHRRHLVFMVPSSSIEYHQSVMSRLKKPPEPPSQPKEWQTEISNDLRCELAKKFMKAIFPSKDHADSEDEQMFQLVDFARTCESQIFSEAESKANYYMRLAEKIYEMQKKIRAVQNKRLAYKHHASAEAKQRARHHVDELCKHLASYEEWVPTEDPPTEAMGALTIAGDAHYRINTGTSGMPSVTKVKEVTETATRRIPREQGFQFPVADATSLPFPHHNGGLTKAQFDFLTACAPDTSGHHARLNDMTSPDEGSLHYQEPTDTDLIQRCESAYDYRPLTPENLPGNFSRPSRPSSA